MLLAVLSQVAQNHFHQTVFESNLLCTYHPIPKEACQIQVEKLQLRKGHKR